MAYTSLSFPYFNPNQSYSKFDIVGGLTATDPNFYYSTVGSNLGNTPNAVFNYTITNYTRYQDQVTLLYNYTGGPAFQIGSMISTSVGADATANYAGMILAGGIGTVTYLNAGWYVAPTASAGTISTIVNPAWTTGFMFVPSYSTSYENQQGVILAEFEEGYMQRQAASINPNVDVWGLAFLDRSSAEAKAIRHFTQNMAGVYSFPIMMTDPFFDNQPNQKFITVAGMKINTKSFQLNDVSVQVRRVFDI